MSWVPEIVTCLSPLISDPSAYIKVDTLKIKTASDQSNYKVPGATCILAPDSDCNLLIISPWCPITLEHIHMP